MRSLWILLLAVVTPPLSARATGEAVRYSVIYVAPAKTSIYIGRLTVTPTPFLRTGTGYKSDLSVELAPYFYHDDAHVFIDVSEAKVRMLQEGRPVDFTGRVVRSNGQSRRLKGRAVPKGTSGGTLAILIYLTSQVTVSFYTTYLVPSPAK